MGCYRKKIIFSLIIDPEQVLKKRIGFSGHYRIGKEKLVSTVSPFDSLYEREEAVYSVCFPPMKCSHALLTMILVFLWPCATNCFIDHREFKFITQIIVFHAGRKSWVEVYFLSPKRQYYLYLVNDYQSTVV